jgi:hypothetical protein
MGLSHNKHPFTVPQYTVQKKMTGEDGDSKIFKRENDGDLEPGKQVSEMA